MAYNKETGMYEGFIYKISNIYNDKLYIGQTVCTISKRWREHKSAAKNKDYSHGQIIYKAMNKYGIDGFNISLVEMAVCKNEEDLFDILDNLEIFYITKYKSLTPDGYNVTPGGSNVSCKTGKAVDAYDANGNKCYSFKTIGEASRFFNRDMSHIVRNCEGEARYAYGYIWRYAKDSFDKYTVDINQNILDLSSGKITINKYDTSSLELLGSYSCISDSLKSIGRNDGGSSITQCLVNKRNTAFGYIWRYSNSDIISRKTGNLHEKPVDVYNVDGILIGNYKSLSDATKHFGLDDNAHSNIVSCCNGRYKTAYGYVWRYHLDSFDKFTVKRNTRAIPVNQYSIDNIYIKTFDSVTKLNGDYGFDRGKLIKCCKGIKDTYKGYRWYYANDVNQPDKMKIINNAAQAIGDING